MNKKKYNALDSVLQEITCHAIRLSNEDKKCYKDHLRKVLECIIEQMKKNKVFKFLYKNNGYTGSFYENLRISKPDEFDINLIFILPAAYEIIYDEIQPGFVKIKVNSLDETQIKKHLNDVPNLEKTLKSWIERKTRYLLRTGFMQWMQGVFTKALDGVSLQDTVIKRSASGPAFTIIVSQPESELSEYSVDLVPVFEFPEKDLPGDRVRKLPKGAVHKEWTVVPKPSPDVTDSTYWRMSFYKQEKEIMNNLNGMKHVIKLMKLFRDQEKWKVLSSYAIKTVFLWECERQPNEGFWQNSVGQLFIHMLRRLSQCLGKNSIPFYWDQNHNLLSKVKSETLMIMNNRITAVLNKINSHLENDPQFIKTFFRCMPKEIQENISPKSDPNCAILIELGNQQADTIEIRSRSSPVATRTQNQVSMLNTLKNDLSSVTLTRNLDECGLPKTKVEEETDMVIQYRIGCKSNVIHKTNTLSDSIIDILLVILKELQEMKQSLCSLTQQFIEIKKEVKELREENLQLRKHLQNQSYRTSIPQCPTAGHSIGLHLNQNSRLSVSQLLVPEKKHLAATNATGQNTFASNPNSSNSYLADMMDIFTA